MTRGREDARTQGRREGIFGVLAVLLGAAGAAHAQQPITIFHMPLEAVRRSRFSPRSAVGSRCGRWWCSCSAGFRGRGERQRREDADLAFFRVGVTW